MATMTINATNKIDDEWQNFISAKYDNDDEMCILSSYQI